MLKWNAPRRRKLATQFSSIEALECRTLLTGMASDVPVEVETVENSDATETTSEGEVDELLWQRTLGESSGAGSHVYADGGIFTITVTVIDDDGAVDGSDFNNRNDNRFDPESDSPPEALTTDDGTVKPAEFNDDGVVDVSDFNIWNDQSSSTEDPDQDTFEIVLVNEALLDEIDNLRSESFESLTTDDGVINEAGLDDGSRPTETLSLNFEK